MEIPNIGIGRVANLSVEVVVSIRDVPSDSCYYRFGIIAFMWYLFEKGSDMNAVFYFIFNPFSLYPNFKLGLCVCCVYL